MAMNLLSSRYEFTVHQGLIGMHNDYGHFLETDASCTRYKSGMAHYWKRANTRAQSEHVRTNLPNTNPRNRGNESAASPIFLKDLPICCFDMAMKD
jgi:hypothetical protein